MTRTLRALAAALALFALPAPALADVAPTPITMHIVGQNAAVTTSGGPTHASFDLRNEGPQATEVFLFRAVVQEGPTRWPMDIEHVEVNGQRVGRTLTVPAGETTRVTVFFDLPERLANRSRWEVDLRVTVSGWGGYDSDAAVLSRATRHPMRKHAATK